MSRAFLTSLLIVVYLGVFNLYIYLLSNGLLGQSERRLMYLYITGGMTLLCLIDLKTITKNDHHIKFNDIAWLSLFANFILNIINHHGFFNNEGASKFLIFNGLIFANTIIVLICLKRHGFFKN